VNLKANPPFQPAPGLDTRPTRVYPYPYPQKTRTQEHGYGFGVGVGAGDA
jgi:hypothetical protein